MIVSLSENNKIENANNQNINQVVNKENENKSNYKNEALNIICNKYSNIDFSKIDDNFVVKVGDICELLNLDCQFVDLKDGCAGELDRNNRVIYINNNYTATRNLFSVAHEIGHYVLHEGMQYRFDDYKKYLTKEQRQIEYEANDFAGKLLMPEYKFVDLYCKKCGNKSKLSDFFGVSLEAVKTRAFFLGLIDNL